MNLFKIKISSLALMALISHNGLCSETDFPIGVKVDRNGEEITSTEALVDLTIPNAGTSIRYQSYGASGMDKVQSTSDHSYAGGGCMQFDTSGSFDASIDLPTGARIISVSSLVIDSSASGNSSGALLIFDAEGGFTNFTSHSTDTAGIPGAVNIGGYLDRTIDSNEAFTGRLFTSGTGTEVCGIRIGYIPPSVASDVIFVNNFFR